MGRSGRGFIESLIGAEIRRHLKNAQGRVVSTAHCVDNVMQVYPSCGLGRRRIADMVIEVAARQGLPVEMDDAAPRHRSMADLLERI